MPIVMFMVGLVKVETTPAGVMRPIEPSLVVNHRFPSGPAVI